MPQVQYPFIDIAVHPAVRARFAAGEAIVLFSRDLNEVLWANGRGARLFGHRYIYDLLDNGPERGGVAFRQMSAAATQLAEPGDVRAFTMRVNSGFKSTATPAEIGLVEIRPGQSVLMFSAQTAEGAVGQGRWQSMLEGFDDPDTHMAVLAGDGEILARSAGFSSIGISGETARMLIEAARRDQDGLIKRPVASGAGYLPAAIGKLSDQPPLYLMFCVETVLGHMDPPEQAASFAEVQPTAPDVIVPAETIAFSSNELAADRIETASTPAEEGNGPDAGEEIVPPDDFSEAMAIAEAPPSGEPDVLPALADLPAVNDEMQADIAADSPAPADETLPPDDYEQMIEEGDDLETASAGEDLADLVRLDGVASDEADWVDEAEAVSEILSGDENGIEQPLADAEFSTGDVAALATPEPEAITDNEPEAIKDNAPEALTEHAPETMTEHQPEVAAEVAPEAMAESAPEASVIEAPIATPSGFVFERQGRPVRFVWKLDADGCFAEVSEEFSRTVGPHSGDINGLSFKDLADRYILDPDGEIAGLLARRDTWSGRTIRWPVEGTDLLVPVDLAALPTYSRNREFDGFRGFGIIRVADADVDPRSLTKDDATPVPEALLAETAADPITLQADAAEASDAAFEQDKADLGDDPFRGELPALAMAGAPAPLVPGLTDKVIQLEERRARAREGLSQTEQAAFREIARQLEPFGKRPNETIESVETDETTFAPNAGQAANNADEIAGVSQPPADDRADEEAAFAAIPAEAGEHAEEVAAVEELDDDMLDDGGLYSEPVAVDPGLTASAADMVPMAILIHAGDRLIHANSEFRRLTGYASLEALDAAGGLDSLILRKEGAEAGVYLVHADQSQSPVSARLQSVRFEGAAALLLALTPVSLAAATAPDDPELTRKLAALTVEADELKSILETATDGVVLLDTDGRIRSMNRSASALFNFNDAEINGKPFAMLFAHESQRSVQDYLAGLSGHGVASVLNDGREVIGREAGGGFIPMFMTMGRMPGSQSYCAVIRDITQWKRSEEELRAAKRAAETANQHKSDFLARVSHEIRTPLNAIIGFSDMIASEHFGPAGHARYVEYANDIGRSGRHVLDIVNDLLDISKIEAGEMDLEFVAVGINDCVSEAVSLVQPQANAQRVIIRTSLSQSVPDVVADLRSIKQIAINILANAIRFTPSGGQIVVSTAYEPSGAVTLRIRDTGIGMSKAELEQAMKPFGQVSPGARKRGDGTGLGLPLTRAMTEANRATFSIHSSPNEGTLVEIIFPPQRVLAD